MIELISKLQISINQRFDHISVLAIDSQDMSALIKDDDKKRSMVRNFRLIKAAEKNRVIEESKCISMIQKLSHRLTKTEIIVCEAMITNCINQYINTEYVVRKNGDPNDLISAFAFYYEKIKANGKVKQMAVIKNCGILQEINFMGENLEFFISNLRTSMNCLYESEKNKFLKLVKQENRSISPQKKVEEEEQQKFDRTGNPKGKKKRQLQLYCYELSKLLNLQHIYLDYYFFNSMDIEKRKKTLEGSYLKRNVFIKRLIQAYEKDYSIFKSKQNKLERDTGSDRDKEREKELS